MAALNDIYAESDPSGTVGRVNRLIASWPSDDLLPAEGIDGVKLVYKKLVSGLHGLKNTEKELVCGI